MRTIINVFVLSVLLSVTGCTVQPKTETVWTTAKNPDGTTMVDERTGTPVFIPMTDDAGVPVTTPATDASGNVIYENKLTPDGAVAFEDLARTFIPPPFNILIPLVLGGLTLGARRRRPE